MTRGRRPNLTLEPSRQLQTQRAFRERKAAHLRDLEERVKRQEEEIVALKLRLGEDVEEEGASKRPRLDNADGSPMPSSSTASSSPPIAQPCGNCQHLHNRNTDLVRQLAETERQLAYHRQLSATTSASGTATTSVTSSPSSISSPVGSSKAAMSYSNAPAHAYPRATQGRIHWTQPLSPSLQVQYHPAQTYDKRVEPLHHTRYPSEPESQQYARLVPSHHAQAAAMYASSPQNVSPQPQCERPTTQSTCGSGPSRCKPEPVKQSTSEFMPDQDKCCLGLFDCDADGRIIV